MKTDENNAMIAEWMGATLHDEDAFGNGHIRHYAVYAHGHHPNQLIKNAGRKFEVKDLIYHESFDWLHPVVQKIGKGNWNFKEPLIFDGISVWYEWVVKVITWINENKIKLT